MEPALRQIIGVHGARMYYNLTSIHSVLRSAPFGDLLAASFNQFVGAEETSDAAGRCGLSRCAQAVELAVDRRQDDVAVPLPDASASQQFEADGGRVRRRHAP